MEERGGNLRSNWSNLSRCGLVITVFLSHFSLFVPIEIARVKVGVGGVEMGMPENVANPSICKKEWKMREITVLESISLMHARA